MVDKIVLIAYALFLFIGAYFGFKKGSMMSLAMGGGSGFIVLLSLWLMSINLRGGWITAACLGGFLCLAFIIRLVKTQAFMPSGMLLIITLAFTIFCLVRLSQLSKV